MKFKELYEELKELEKTNENANGRTRFIEGARFANERTIKETITILAGKIGDTITQDTIDEIIDSSFLT